MTLRNLYRVLLLLVITFPLTGCLFRSHKVQPREVSKAPLKTATQAELIEYVNTQAARVQSMQATVDSDGQVFKLWIPPKNRFIIGRNDIETHNIQQPLENLRPQQIYDALLLPQIDQKNEIAVVENSTEIVRDAKGHNLEQPNYEIDVIRNGEHGWFLARKILFSRTDLLPHRQLIYNPAGDLVSDIHYESYKDFSGVNFPSIIEIWRPQEEYDITLTIVKLQLNEPLPNDKFTLEQPPGAQVVRLDQPPTKTPPGGDGR